MKSTHFKVEAIFGGMISKDSISSEQIPKPNIFSGEKNAILTFRIKINSFKPRRKKMILKRVLLLKKFFSN